VITPADSSSFESHSAAPCAESNKVSSADPPESYFWELLRSDLRAMIFDRGNGKVAYLASAVLKTILFPRIQVALLYRLSHLAYRWRLMPLAYLFQAIGLVLSGAEIHPAAKIGPFICLIHSSGIVIGDRVVIGQKFKCFQGVTVGDSGKNDGQPWIGDNVTLSAGAKVLGGIRIGHRAVVGANAVVLIDVPDGGVAVGVPARVVKIDDAPAAW
jgi:serine O-acetyltransferase